MKIASFFSGAGGLDEGFKRAEYTTVFANEFDAQIAANFESNHLGVEMFAGSITALVNGFSTARDVDGFVGGPPCQSWSAAGAKRGVADPRGQLFFSYLGLIDKIRPKFFVAENVPGILAARNSDALLDLLAQMNRAGYNVSYGLLNASDYGVAQDRKRVIFVGINKDLNSWFQRPQEILERRTLRLALEGLSFEPEAVPFGRKLQRAELEANNNHHYLDSGHYSPIYMSRNRVRPWDEQSFTIQASASHVPLHPQAPTMEFVSKDLFRFSPGAESMYRRLSVRECARIQDFPDTYKFQYRTIGLGYKMIGNAVPVGLAHAIGQEIRSALTSRNAVSLLPGEVAYRF